MKPLEVLTLVFVILKLVGIITWSWWLVLLPSLITVSLITIMFVIYVIAVVVERIEDNK